MWIEAFCKQRARDSPGCEGTGRHRANVIKYGVLWQKRKSGVEERGRSEDQGRGEKVEGRREVGGGRRENF